MNTLHHTRTNVNNFRKLVPTVTSAIVFVILCLRSICEKRQSEFRFPCIPTIGTTRLSSFKIRYFFRDFRCPCVYACAYNTRGTPFTVNTLCGMTAFHKHVHIIQPPSNRIRLSHGRSFLMIQLQAFVLSAMEV